MKILFVCHLFHKKPALYKESHSLTILGLQKALKKLGHKVDILQTNKMFPKIKEKYDVVHGFSGAPIKVLRTLFVGKQCSAKTVHTIRSISPHLFGGYKFAKLLNKVDIITVPLNCLKWRFIKKGVDKNKIEVIHSNIDIKKFKPKKVKKIKPFKRKPMIFYWGALWPEKGVNELLEAAKLLPNINFVFLPRYDNWSEIKDTSLMLLKNVYFLHSGANLTKILNMSSAVCLPYRTLTKTDANPSCLLEAWANKKPVILSHLEELEEIADNKVWWTEPNNPEELASDIQILLDSGLGKHTAEDVYKYVLEFDHSFIAFKYELLYKFLEVNYENNKS